ncbi:MAG TPA: hypothetical protein DD490_05655 [Acidobacteria bacterium]|nr:hypothetical protein [Acidobacteriota bacterium]
MRNLRWMQKIPVVLALFAASGTASAAEPPMLEAVLDVPFVLVVGQTGRVEPEGLEITLRSASDDSGCLTPRDCSMATFKGTIALRLGEETDLASVHAILRGEGVVSVDFAGYTIHFGAVRRLREDEIQATFTVTSAAGEG